MRFALALLLAACLAGCDSASDGSADASGQSTPPRPSPGGSRPPPPAPTDDLTGGVVFTFEVEGETFAAWLVHPDTVAELEAAWNATRAVPGLASVIRSGPGNCDHNLPWSWHLDPLSAFVQAGSGCGCTVLPSEIEADPTRWTETYCMALSPPLTIVDLADHR